MHRLTRGLMVLILRKIIASPFTRIETYLFAGPAKEHMQLERIKAKFKENNSIMSFDMHPCYVYASLEFGEHS